VLEDFVYVRILFLRNVSELLEQRQITVGFDVALRAGIVIPVPGPAEVAAGLDYPEVADTGLFEPSTGEQTREAAADNNYLDLIRQRFANKAPLEVRVIFCVMGELPGQLDVLRFTIVAEGLSRSWRYFSRSAAGSKSSPAFAASIGSGALASTP